jgi:hypothetical protein
MIRRDFLRLSAISAVGVAVLRHVGWAAIFPKTKSAVPTSPSSRPWLVGSSRLGCARPLECAEILNSWRRQSRAELPL